MKPTLKLRKRSGKPYVYVKPYDEIRTMDIHTLVAVHNPNHKRNETLSFKSGNKRFHIKKWGSKQCTGGWFKVIFANPGKEVFIAAKNGYGQNVPIEAVIFDEDEATKYLAEKIEFL